MDIRFPPLTIKILLESNSLKSRIFVRRLAVDETWHVFPQSSRLGWEACVKFSIRHVNMLMISISISLYLCLSLSLSLYIYISISLSLSIYLSLSLYIYIYTHTHGVSGRSRTAFGRLWGYPQSAAVFVSRNLWPLAGHGQKHISFGHACDGNWVRARQR